MKTTKKAPKAKKPATIKSPPMRTEGPNYVGKTIRQLRQMRSLKRILEIAKEAPVSLSKDRGNTFGKVGENYHLHEGDVVQFSRAPGTKCNITLCNGCGKEHCLEHGDCL